MNADICMGCFEPMNGFEVCSHCGWYRDSVPEHAYHLYQGTVLHGRYIVGNTVGVGGFGITYRAWDASLNSMVAIKEFYPAGLVSRVPGEKDLVIFSGEKKERFDIDIKRFLEEARTMAKFTGHPNIVHVFDFFEENNTAYIVMEFLDGITVKEFLESSPNGKIDVQTSAEIVSHVLDALTEMHSKKIIHRDISPDNIQITSKNEIKIFDLGAAKLTKEDNEETRSIVVKTGYTPPEQYRAKSKQGAFTDLYSVGAVFYKLISGETPEESVDRIVEDHLSKPSKLGIDIDINIERAIMKALALKPELRFQNASQFKDAIMNKKTVDFPEDELRKRRKIRIAFTSILSVFTVAFFTAFGIYFTSEKSDPLDADDGKIVVCLPVSPDEAVAGEQIKMYRDIVEKFEESTKQPTRLRENGNEFEVELITVNQSEYQNYLMEQFATGNAPSVFNTDFFGDELVDYTAKLGMLVESVSTDHCIIMDEYKKVYPNMCEMPTGLYVNVIYANQAAARTIGIEIPSSIENVEELFNDAYSSEGVYQIAVAEDNVDDTLTAMLDDSLYSYKTKKINPLASQSFMCIGNALQKQGFKYADGMPLVRFTNNQLVYYIDDTTELANFRRYLPGYYTVLPLTSNGNLIVSMTKHVGVNKNADKNEQKIAMQFIRFMLADYSQDVMHVQNNIAIPVNPNTLSNYLSYNGDIAFVSDYLENLKVIGEARHICYDFNVKLYDEIMVPDNNYSNVDQYMDIHSWRN